MEEIPEKVRIKIENKVGGYLLHLQNSGFLEGKHVDDALERIRAGKYQLYRLESGTRVHWTEHEEGPFSEVGYKSVRHVGSRAMWESSRIHDDAGVHIVGLLPRLGVAGYYAVKTGGRVSIRSLGKVREGIKLAPIHGIFVNHEGQIYYLHLGPGKPRIKKVG